jgi:hypothetical protein
MWSQSQNDLIVTRNRSEANAGRDRALLASACE